MHRAAPGRGGGGVMNEPRFSVLVERYFDGAYSLCDEGREQLGREMKSGSGGGARGRGRARS